MIDNLYEKNTIVEIVEMGVMIFLEWMFLLVKFP